MATGTEISFIAVSALSGLAAASMQSAVDVSSPDLNLTSGSLGTVANSLSLIEVSDSLALVSGSYLGVANTGSSVDVQLESSLISTGSYLGTGNSVAVSEVPEEERNSNVTTNDNPSPNEGQATIDWNPFPQETPEPPEEVATRDRDLTRFQKAYSFRRQHPVRIRVFRR